MRPDSQASLAHGLDRRVNRGRRLDGLGYARVLRLLLYGHSPYFFRVLGVRLNTYGPIP